jgi:transposase-like protein
MTLIRLYKLFPTEEAAIDYFLTIRYGGEITCPHCGNTAHLYRYTDRGKAFHCYKCHNSFSPFSDTIFRKTHLDLRQWFVAIALFLDGRKGISACQIGRNIGVSYPTAWRMLQQIRIAMSNEDTRKAFESIVEIDETYVGGKPRKYNTRLDEQGHPIQPELHNKRGRGTKKTPVVGVKERSTGNVYAKVMLPNDQGMKLSGKQLLGILNTACKNKTTVISDDFKGYNILDKPHDNQFVHLTVNHSLGQYSAGNGIHTNGIENFWSIFKRGHYGMYHHMSVKYLQRYVNEFCFRQNTRKHKNAFDILLSRCVLRDWNIIQDTILGAA